MLDPFIAADALPFFRDGLDLIQGPSWGSVLSEVGSEAPAATGGLTLAFARQVSNDREAAGANLRLPISFWLAAKLFTNALRSCS